MWKIGAYKIAMSLWINNRSTKAQRKDVNLLEIVKNLYL